MTLTRGLSVSRNLVRQVRGWARPSGEAVSVYRASGPAVSVENRALSHTAAASATQAAWYPLVSQTLSAGACVGGDDSRALTVGRGMPTEPSGGD